MVSWIILKIHMQKKFSHIAKDGSVNMVDVSHKTNTLRIAIVRGCIDLSAETLALLQNTALPKGDVLTTAKLAGIMAAKRTAELVPLCHPLALTFMDVRFTVKDFGLELEAEARTAGPTGVEMEALVGAQMAAATVYDMCKAVQKNIVIRDIRLVYKSGGKSGIFCATDFIKD